MFTHTQSPLASSKGQSRGSLVRRQPHPHGTAPLLPAIPCSGLQQGCGEENSLLIAPLLGQGHSTRVIQHGCAARDSSFPLPPSLHRAGAQGLSAGG